MVEGAAAGQCLGFPSTARPSTNLGAPWFGASKGSGPPKPLTCSKRAPDRSLASMPDTLPVIDLSDTPALAGNVGAAARDVGFFYLTGHGMPPALIAEVFQASPPSSPSARRPRSGTRSSARRTIAATSPCRARASIPTKAGGSQGGLQHRPRPCPEDPRVIAGKPFRGVNLWPDLPGWRETMLAYFNAVWGDRPAAPPRDRAAISASTRTIFEDKLDRPWRRSACSTIRRSRPKRRCRPDRRRRAHRLWRRDAAHDRRGRRPGSAPPRRRLARRAENPRRLHLQHRRLPDALDQRRLRLDAAPRHQPRRPRALFGRLLPRPQSRRRSSPACPPAPPPTAPPATPRSPAPTTSPPASTPPTRTARRAEVSPIVPGIGRAAILNSFFTFQNSSRPQLSPTRHCRKFKRLGALCRFLLHAKSHVDHGASSSPVEPGRNLSRSLNRINGLAMRAAARLRLARALRSLSRQPRAGAMRAFTGGEFSMSQFVVSRRRLLQGRGLWRPWPRGRPDTVPPGPRRGAHHRHRLCRPARRLRLEPGACRRPPRRSRRFRA